MADREPAENSEPVLPGKARQRARRRLQHQVGTHVATHAEYIGACADFEEHTRRPALLGACGAPVARRRWTQRLYDVLEAPTKRNRRPKSPVVRRRRLLLDRAGVHASQEAQN